MDVSLPADPVYGDPGHSASPCPGDPVVSPVCCLVRTTDSDSFYIIWMLPDRPSCDCEASVGPKSGEMGSTIISRGTPEENEGAFSFYLPGFAAQQMEGGE